MANGKQKFIIKVNELLIDNFGIPPRNKKLPDPVEMLIATILSQNTNDRNSFQAYQNLKKKFSNWTEILKTQRSIIEKEIKVAGLGKQKSEAIKIGKDLLKKKLIACYNLIPVESAYWWKGKIFDDKETLMILKAQKKDYGKIESIIIKLSSYETPEVISVKPDKVNKSYLNWISAETK